MTDRTDGERWAFLAMGGTSPEIERLNRRPDTPENREALRAAIDLAIEAGVEVGEE
jgi:hypothetical protein